MEIVDPRILLSKSKQEIKDWFDDRLGKSIIIRLKKAPISKTKALSAQDVFSVNKKQSYAMYMNYLFCLKADIPTIRVMSTKITPLNNLFVYGCDTNSMFKKNLVINENQISRNRVILVLDKENKY